MKTNFNEEEFYLILVILITIFFIYILQRCLIKRNRNVFDIEQESYYQQHKVILTITPMVFSWILQMWCKDQNEKTNSNKLLIDYVEECKTKKGKDHFTKEEKEKVRNEKLDEIDVTLLYKIFLKVCKNTINFNVKEGETLGDIESKIRKAKEFRNYIQHSIPNETTIKKLGDPNELVSYQEHMIKLLKMSADRLNVDRTELSSFIGKIKVDIKKIRDSPIINYKSNVLAYNEFKNKLNEKYNQMEFCTDIEGNWLTLHDIPKRYHNLKVKRSVNHNPGKNITSTELYNLFQMENIIFVSGDAGTGKSFFLIQMLHEFFKGEKYFIGIKHYDLVIYCQCRDTILKTIKDMLDISKFSQNPSWDWKAFLHFLKAVKILFLIDGFDEIHEVSHGFIQELLSHFRDKNFIITGRPGSEERIPRQKIVLGLEGVIGKDNQIQFIEKISPNKSNVVLDRINNLPNIIQELTTIPFYLTCFCSLFNNGKLSNLDLPTDFIDRFLELKKSFFVTRMLISSSMDEFEISYGVDDLMTILNEIALNSLRNDRVILEKDDVKKLLISYRKKFDEKNSQKYLSSFLSCKKTDSTPPSIHYAFHHKSIQEYCAAKHLQLISRNDIKIIWKIQNTYQYSKYYRWKNSFIFL